MTCCFHRRVFAVSGPVSLGQRVALLSHELDVSDCLVVLDSRLSRLYAPLKRVRLGNSFLV